MAINQKLMSILSDTLFQSPWAMWEHRVEDFTGKLISAVNAGQEITAETSLNPNSLAIQNGTAIIPIEGMIVPRGNGYWGKYTACSDLVAAYRNALANETVQRIAVMIDTPGGSVLGLPEAAQDIFELRGQKPVACYVSGLCASAGYFLGSAFGPIYGSSSSMIGSIGSVLMHLSWQGMLEQVGVKATPIHFGQHKVDGNNLQDLTAQSKATLQEMVDAFGQQFVNAVAQNRGISTKDVLDRYGQGKVFIASAAKDRKMVEGVMSQMQFFAQLNQMTASPVKAAASQLVVATVMAPSPLAISASQAIELVAAPLQNKVVTAAVAPKVERDISISGGQITGGRQVKLSPKIKAALYALELTDAVDASDEICIASIKSYCKAQGQAVPESEAEILSLLTGGEKKATPTKSEKPALSAQEFLEISNNLKSSASVFNDRRETPLITAEEVDAEITAVVKGEKTELAVQQSWKAKMAADKKEPVAVTKVAEDAFVKSATDVLMNRMGYATKEAPPADMRSMSLLEIGQRCAAFTGLRLYGSREEQAKQLLQINPLDVPMSSASFNRAGDFPNLLSALAGKILDAAIELADPTYPDWTNRLMDVPDFKPKTVLSIGSFDQLSEVMEDEDPKQLKFSEELKGFIQAGQYANKVGLTPVMLANDDLDGFNLQLQSLMMAHEFTLNSLCVKLLTGNVTLVDTGALFNSTAMTTAGGHANLATGAAIDATSAKAMKLLLRKQVGVGTTRQIKAYPNVVLVPTDLEDAAEQTYLTMAELLSRGGEQKIATTDATINTHRGKTKIVVEPELDAATTTWYAIDKRFRTIVHAFQSGYGRGGQRTTWYDTARGTRYIKLEGRFGAAAVGFRGIAKNPGP